AKAYVADTFTTSPPVAAAAVVADAISSMRQDAYLASTRICFGVRLARLLPHITAPTLVLWGERDQKTPRELSERIATAIPSARLETIPAAGHLSNAENPAAFTAALRHFLSTVRS
ncbi:MAG TPA: alpha/beta fold hydrolase, partial [Candidatus Dormibacteraeota bacterium]|nr:alpha/beta fold hydrolase [Candidatus Dormibacteraeota bacterium]